MLAFCAEGRGFDPQPGQKVISIFHLLHVHFFGMNLAIPLWITLMKELQSSSTVLDGLLRVPLIVP